MDLSGKYILIAKLSGGIDLRISVLHVIRPADGGMKNHLLNLARYTDRNIYQVKVACPAGSNVEKELQELGIDTLPLPLKGKLSLFTDVQTIGLLVYHLKKGQFTIVHTHGAKAALVGRVAAVIANTPVVISTVHNSIFYDNWSSYKKRVMAMVERILTLKTDAIITVSEALKKELMHREKISKHKLFTIYNGINLNKIKTASYDIRKNLQVPCLGRLVAVIARLAPQKGIRYFIKAAALLKEQQIIFLIIGDGPLREELKAEVETLGLKDRVFFTGHRSNIEEILPCLDVLVLPSVTEGLPLVILEAMAAGCPVVATKVGGIPEVVNDGVNGLLVEPQNPEQLATAITELINDDIKAAQLGKRGRKIVQQNYTIEQMLDQTMALYSSILNNKGIFIV